MVRMLYNFKLSGLDLILFSFINEEICEGQGMKIIRLLFFSVKAYKLYSYYCFIGTLMCDIGWHPGYNGNCYYFSRNAVTFYTAMVKYHKKWGHTKLITSPLDQFFIKILDLNKNLSSLFCTFRLYFTDLGKENLSLLKVINMTQKRRPVRVEK